MTGPLHRDTVKSYPKPAKKCKKAQAAKVTIKEKDLQSMAEEYLNIRGVVYIRIPDTLMSKLYGTTSIGLKEKTFIANYLKGISDLTIFHPTVNVDGFPITMSLELKTEAGKPSKHQIYWAEKVRGCIAYGWDDIRFAIDRFLDVGRDA